MFLGAFEDKVKQFNALEKEHKEYETKARKQGYIPSKDQVKITLYDAPAILLEDPEYSFLDNTFKDASSYTKPVYGIGYIYTIAHVEPSEDIENAVIPSSNFYIAVDDNGDIRLVEEDAILAPAFTASFSNGYQYTYCNDLRPLEVTVDKVDSSITIIRNSGEIMSVIFYDPTLND